MEIQKRVLADGTVRWRVRWRQAGRGSRYRARTFDRRGDATRFAAELQRRQQLGSLAFLDSGRVTLAEYVADTWARTYRGNLSLKTRELYGYLYDTHILPDLGEFRLVELTPELIAGWQADRLAAGAGPVAIRKAVTLLGGILQRALEGGHIATNPARKVREAPLPRRSEVRPLAPRTIERMRAVSRPGDATMIGTLGFAGLRPGEALALQWRDIRPQTILIERSLSFGEAKDTKTTEHRTVRLLAPLAMDLREWRLRSGRPDDRGLVFPGRDGRAWSDQAYRYWRRHIFSRAAEAAGAQGARPYDLRHSFASLLLHEGRSVIYVARQLGHDARLTLSTYGHVIDELDGLPRIDAETAIFGARETLHAPPAEGAAQP